MKNALSATIFAIAILSSVVILSNTYRNRFETGNSISVTGQGKRDFKSDLIVWNGRFTQKNYELKEAYRLLQQDQEKIRAYLAEKGIEENFMVFSSVDINKEYDYTFDEEGNRRSEFSGYRLTQRVEIESPEIDKIESLAREITELINLGVEFYSQAPQYYYTKLSELKIEMISAATEDARLRAQKIAENAGAELGELKDARMGIFQIIGQNSNEDYSWGGTFNTSSKMKTATVTMKLEFGIN